MSSCCLSTGHPPDEEPTVEPPAPFTLLLFLLEIGITDNRVINLLKELGHVSSARQPRHNLAVDYVNVKIQGPKKVGCPFWFVVGCPPSSVQDGHQF